MQVPKIRLSDTVDPASARQVAQALGVWADNMDARQAALAVADMLEGLDAPHRRCDPVTATWKSRATTRRASPQRVKNFNANAGVRSVEDQIADALRLLEAAY